MRLSFFSATVLAIFSAQQQWTANAILLSPGKKASNADLVPSTFT